MQRKRSRPEQAQKACSGPVLRDILGVLGIAIARHLPPQIPGADALAAAAAIGLPIHHILIGGQVNRVIALCTRVPSSCSSQVSRVSCCRSTTVIMVLSVYLYTSLSYPFCALRRERMPSQISSRAARANPMPYSKFSIFSPLCRPLRRVIYSQCIVNTPQDQSFSSRYFPQRKNQDGHKCPSETVDKVVYLRQR